ncbi:DUF4349 domain-containing protein [Paraliobacillus salinarum]|uniref:DUF4349 domain-containing protein n=1 Tax=Paraliobacillus salinarum TaxID=1158996 RepID=UPI0015F77269|nr:DUF4349 domain-containing protein [Paraliobacillus salinarum]
MSKMFRVLFVLLFVFILFGCSGNGSSDDGADYSSEIATEDAAMGESFSSNSKEGAVNETSEQAEQQDGEELPKGAETDRKIIYNANVTLEVKDFQGTIERLEKEIDGAGGYIVSSDSYQIEKNVHEGTITARIPQEQFEAFISMVEKSDMKVTQKNISGEDVTEQYVDLEARLKSKQVVEKRLLAFMEQAEKTEDLLKISNDLANVQEEIEQITGRMNYLKNKSDFATVSLHIQERRVDIVQDEDLNTWDKVQEQMKRSVNFLLSAGSSMIIFLIGNLPILIIFAIAGGIGYFVWRRQRNKKE